MTSATIRVVPYSQADVEDVALIHLAAFKGYMSARLGLSYTKAFLSWFLTYPNSITLKAELDGKLCGYAIGAPLSYAKAISRDLLWVGIRSIIANPGVIVHRSFLYTCRARLRILLTRKKKSVAREAGPEGKGISLIGIGVTPQFSGAGVGHTIMGVFEENARSMGMDYMVLSVYGHNTRARTTYEKSGWRILKEVGNGIVYSKHLR